MFIDDKWYSEPELLALVRELKDRINSLELENDELRLIMSNHSGEENECSD